MSKVIATMNMTLDGFCDHTAMNGDDETHQHYTELLKSSGAMIYGRITYQLMENYWPAIVHNPTGNPRTDEFALTIDNIPKVVFSHTLENVEWQTARLTKRGLREEVSELKKTAVKDILVGSPSLIAACMNLDLVDEYQLCVHPTIVRQGLPLFKDVNHRVDLKLLNTKLFTSGAVTFYYEPIKNN